MAIKNFRFFGHCRKLKNYKMLFAKVYLPITNIYKSINQNTLHQISYFHQLNNFRIKESCTSP